MFIGVQFMGIRVQFMSFRIQYMGVFFIVQFMRFGGTFCWEVFFWGGGQSVDG